MLDPKPRWFISRQKLIWHYAYWPMDGIVFKHIGLRLEFLWAHGLELKSFFLHFDLGLEFFGQFGLGLEFFLALWSMVRTF